MKKLSIVLALGLLMMLACRDLPTDERLTIVPGQLAEAKWPELIARARGSTVNFGMWAGDEVRNRYFQGPVAEAFKRDFGITFKVVPCSDTVEMVNKLLNEKGAGKTRHGSIDLLWINGENFRTAKQAQVLWGPFADNLPNIRYYDIEARARDFGTWIDGFEAPWQRSQFVLAYDNSRVTDPPRSVEALRSWIKAHPGRFTYLAPPDFTGSVFIRHILFHFGGGAKAFQNDFNEALYQRAAADTIAYLNDIKPFLWRNGETYPTTHGEVDRLFVNNEIDFTMSYSPTFATDRINRGEYPATVRTFVFDEGTVSNYSFLAIPFNANNLVGALVAINHLISPEHALDKSRTLGTIFPINIELLSSEERQAVTRLPRGVATLSPEELDAHKVPEADAQYLERLEKDWLEKVLRR